ncbi:hypothetical protein HJC23_001533 [Cyclotella cryptica]|uniref:RING-type domain-containing protein n=1 Tax=Cyclotella cryptica TaxID=29204 RepID=A0ABD3PWB7_9STRA|eukprot:CCRYP_010750-RA/>CCRYP_010750-RA protein AED:0.31 eAED:0.31 QI:0/-1/0/1/-1/1/1/0/427
MSNDNDNDNNLEHQPQYPSRIKSFCRQNHNNPRRLTLLPLFYTLLVSLYGYGLLFRNVSSSRLYANRDGTVSDLPLTQSEGVELEPQSLAHVAITNAEELWRRRVQREEYLRKRAELRKEMLHKKLNNEIIANAIQKGNNVTNFTPISIRSNLNSTNATATSAAEYFKNLQATNQRIASTKPKRRVGRGTKPPSGTQNIMIPFFLMITSCSILRLFLSFAITRFAEGGDDDDHESDNAHTPTTEGGGAFAFLSGGRNASRLRRRARAQIRQRQFQSFVDRLNAQRVSNGERPIGAESLRLVVSSRDFDGNDYERLWQFHEENGPALGSLFSSIGATEAEIRRCPSRVLGEGDDLVRRRGEEEGTSSALVSGGGGVGNGHSCSVCLESYRVGDEVRTIPCFHTFHTACIDPWLAERAECPICKHSAIG